MNTYRAVLFDLDGTLLNTLDDLADSVNAALAAYGYPLRRVDEVRAFIGNGVRCLMERALPTQVSAEHLDEVLATFRAHYLTHSRDKTAPYAGIPALLAALRERGVRVAVVTNKLETAARELCDHYFGPLVELTVGDCAGRERKPAPDGVLAALAALGVAAEEAVYIGDTNVDIETARRAGLASIAVLWGFRDEESLRAAGAQCFAATPDELGRLLLAAEK